MSHLQYKLVTQSDIEYPPEFSAFWVWKIVKLLIFNTLGHEQNSRHFADDIFKYIFLTENVCVLIHFFWFFFHKGPIENMPSLVPVMALRRTANKLLPEQMLTKSMATMG